MTLTEAPVLVRLRVNLPGQAAGNYAEALAERHGFVLVEFIDRSRRLVTTKDIEIVEEDSE